MKVIGIIPDNTRLLEFPELRQTYGYDCGALALQSVLVYYGLDIREELVMKKLGTSRLHGTNIDQMVAGAIFYGLEVIAEHSMCINQITSSVDNGWPVILDLQAWADEEKIRKKGFTYRNTWNEGHYVVAIGYGPDRIYFEDPSDPKRTFLSFEQLNDRWHDQDDNGKKYAHWGMICKASPVFRRNQCILMG